ncbi:hypothetical protein S58_01200 [Bradyrhizobium oligotrophicum S58]|uniref:Uncharacterized protein n=1 Tax=Bradyrhizobium oligotrophicum S58 TaxID=1245469 RepID=M4ZIR3_9BRAD|nr:hypothetical protein S58_01200 [Bradyrhizobium oligotrophicum S58]
MSDARGFYPNATAVPTPASMFPLPILKIAAAWQPEGANAPAGLSHLFNAVA